ncbi:MAG: nucleoside-diphosphate sugar epimerase/dehydratase [Lacipirellulaceae bacterium]
MTHQQRIARVLAQLALLSPILVCAYWASYMLRFSGAIPEFAQHAFTSTVAIMLAIKATSLVWFRAHHLWSRYVSLHDLQILAQAVTIATLGFTLLDALLLPNIIIPRSVILLDWGVTLVALATVRALPRVMSNLQWKAKAHEGVRAFIVGATDSGETLLRTLHGKSSLAYKCVGILDDRPRYRGRRLAGVEVLGGLDDTARLVKQYHVAEVLITAGELPGLRVRQLMDLAEENNFRVKVLPSYDQLLAEQVAVQPRPVAIADLLGRPHVELDDSDTRDWLNGKTLLVTGSSGSIGSEVCRQLLKMNPAKLVVLDRSETGQFFLERELRRLHPSSNIEVALADINDGDRLEAVFEQYQPDIVFHAAAYKHVPLMEAHVGEGVKNIALATRKLADLAHDFEVESFVMISTDKAVNPTSVMGSCKRLAEQYVQAKASTSDTRFVTVRFGNVLDSAGSVVPIFREQIARGGPITVTDEKMVRYFMMIPEAAQLVIQAGAMGQGGEIFVLDMGEPVRIVDLAKDMIRLSGLRVDEDIEIKFSGLRPGEKLYEELYGTEENHTETPHPKIMVAESKTRSLLEIIYDFSRLEEVANGPNDVCAAMLQEIIPLTGKRTASAKRLAA